MSGVPIGLRFSGASSKGEIGKIAYPPPHGAGIFFQLAWYREYEAVGLVPGEMGCRCILAVGWFCLVWRHPNPRSVVFPCACATPSASSNSRNPQSSTCAGCGLNPAEGCSMDHTNHVTCRTKCDAFRHAPLADLPNRNRFGAFRQLGRIQRTVESTLRADAG